MTRFLPAGIFLLGIGFSALLPLPGWADTDAGQAKTQAAAEPEMVRIPAGDFLMGSRAGQGRPGYDYGGDELPQRKVDLKAYFMDRHEVTVGQFREFLKATGKTWTAEAFMNEIYPPELIQNPEKIADYPASFLEWGEADAYCRWRGGRLPTEEEWEKGARGTDGRSYPWGDAYDPLLAGTSDLKMKHPAVVESFPDDRSPYGLFDMAGNVAEWTASFYLPYPGNPSAAEGAWTTQAYVVRGGSFHASGKFQGRTSARSLAYPTYSHMMYGFRCARDAQP